MLFFARIPLRQKLFVLSFVLIALIFAKIFFFNFTAITNSNPTVLKRSQYCVIYNFLQAEKLGELETTITLAVHSTLNYAHNIYEQVLTWDHLISLAIFVRSSEEIAVLDFLNFWHCFKPIRSKVSVHLVWQLSPFQRNCEYELVKVPFENKCESISPKLPIRNSSDLPEFQYPINYLRNVARLGAQSGVHIVADVENIFSEGFANLVQNFTSHITANPDEKYVYIFRRFEVDESELNPPKTIVQLFEAFSDEKAFEFHQKLFALGHVISDVSEWFNYSMNSTEVVATEFKYRNANFEPQFLMPVDATMHFEDVPARFYDHQLLINELCRAGYKFRILSHVFNVHMGVKRELNEVEALVNKLAMKEAQKSKVRKKFGDHLNRKYGSDWPPTKCPPF